MSEPWVSDMLRGEERLKCSHKPDPCWTCQLEKSNRELADENRSLRNQLRVADEQCHQQVADAVRERDLAHVALRKSNQVMDEACFRSAELEEKLAEAETRYGQRVVEMNSLRRHNEILAAASKEARQVARRYFKWIGSEENPETEFTEAELHKYPWLEERHR